MQRRSFLASLAAGFGLGAVARKAVTAKPFDVKAKADEVLNFAADKHGSDYVTLRNICDDGTMIYMISPPISYPPLTRSS